jgi:hypothetical protein
MWHNFYHKSRVLYIYTYEILHDIALSVYRHYERTLSRRYIPNCYCNICSCTYDIFCYWKVLYWCDLVTMYFLGASICNKRWYTRKRSSFSGATTIYLWSHTIRTQNHVRIDTTKILNDTIIWQYIVIQSTDLTALCRTNWRSNDSDTCIAQCIMRYTSSYQWLSDPIYIYKIRRNHIIQK